MTKATKTPQIYIFDSQKVFLHALHVHFSSFDILKMFSFFLRSEMTCFAVVWTTWAYDDKCSILYSYVPSAGSNLIPGLFRTHFSSIMTLNNWKMIAETRSYICRWRSRFRRRCVCLSSLMLGEARLFKLFHWTHAEVKCFKVASEGAFGSFSNHESKQTWKNDAITLTNHNRGRHSNEPIIMQSKCLQSLSRAGKCLWPRDIFLTDSHKQSISIVVLRLHLNPLVIPGWSCCCLVLA